MFGRLKCFGYFFLFVFALAWGQASTAAEPCTAQPTGVKRSSDIQGPHPAMFRVVNGKSIVYLLGSIHVLPFKFLWCTPAIGQAIDSANVFFFEANLDFATSEFHYFIDQHGYLPRGQTLHEKLSPAAQKRYFTLIKDFHIDPNRLDYLQPGVAFLLLQNLHGATTRGVELVPGVDAALTRYAKDQGKEVAYLETLQSQFDVLTALGGGTQITMLEKALTDLEEEGGPKFLTILNAWANGDLEKLSAMDEEEPDQKALLLDKRNRAWLPRIEVMLSVPKTYLVTVGVLHLSGPNSVIDLLCAKSWKVERIQTGTSRVEPLPDNAEKLAPVTKDACVTH